MKEFASSPISTFSPIPFEDFSLLGKFRSKGGGKGNLSGWRVGTSSLFAERDKIYQPICALDVCRYMMIYHALQGKQFMPFFFFSFFFLLR